MSVSLGESRFDRLRVALRERYGERPGELIASLLRPAYVVARSALRTWRWPPYAYERFVAPVVARRLWLLLWPAYWYFRRRRTTFLVNMGTGTGHVLIEMDWYLRMKRTGALDPDRRYALVLRRHIGGPTVIARYRCEFDWARASTLLYLLLLPLTMRFPDITLDIGLSPFKSQLDEAGSGAPRVKTQNYLYATSKADLMTRFAEYGRLRAKTVDDFPMRRNFRPQKDLLDLLGGSPERLALVHVKDRAIGHAAHVTDPLSYVPAIEHLQHLGFTVVFVGRERMPSEFRGLGLIDYANSRAASFVNDFAIFDMSDLSITGGGGITLFPEVLGRPYLGLNYWILSYPPRTRMGIHVPAVVDTRDGRRLTFSQQVALFMRTPSPPEVFPSENFVAHDASGVDVLAATRELLALTTTPVPPSDRQEQFNSLIERTTGMPVGGRVSERFLGRNQDRLA